MLVVTTCVMALVTNEVVVELEVVEKSWNTRGWRSSPIPRWRVRRHPGGSRCNSAIKADNPVLNRLLVLDGDNGLHGGINLPVICYRTVGGGENIGSIGSQGIDFEIQPAGQEGTDTANFRQRLG